MKQEESLVINPEFSPLLSRHGLETFDDFMRYDHVQTVKPRPCGSLSHLELEGTGFYLKRDVVFYLKSDAQQNYQDRRRLPRTVHRRWPVGMIEWDMSWRLRKLGIHTPTPVAAGTRRTHQVQESFSLVQALDGAERLDKHLLNRMRPPLNREMVRHKHAILAEVARIARTLHAAKLHHQDLFLHHFMILLQPGGDAEKPILILTDLERLGRPCRCSQWGVVKDLAKLYYSSLDECYCTRSDRLRFYQIYAGKRRPRGLEKLSQLLVRLKAQRIRHYFVKRERYQGFRYLPGDAACASSSGDDLDALVGE